MEPFRQLDEPGECDYCSRTAYSTNLAGKEDCGSCELDPAAEQNERANWVSGVVAAANNAIAYLEGQTGYGSIDPAKVLGRLRSALGTAAITLPHPQRNEKEQANDAGK